MENFFAIFPRYGKIFSTLWKNRPVFSTQWTDFSTQWKKCFHSVENSDLGLFSVVLGLFSGAVERSARRPL